MIGNICLVSYMNDSSAICTDDKRKARTLVGPDSAALRSRSRLLLALLPFLSVGTTLPGSSAEGPIPTLSVEPATPYTTKLAQL